MIRSITTTLIQKILIPCLALVLLLTACDTGEYEEPFDEAGSWGIGRTSDVTGKVENGVYEMLVKSNSELYMATAGESFSDGVYEVEVSGLTASTVPCVFYDNWKGLTIDGVNISNTENQFVINPLSDLYQIGSDSNEPSLYGFDFYGIKQDEKILNTDIRKVSVILKKAYTTKEVLTHVDCFYRIYVKEGTTEVQVQDWTPINRTNSGYYFMFDTRDKIPNEYFIDIKVNTDREVNTYKREIKFQIVNKK